MRGRLRAAVGERHAPAALGEAQRRALGGDAHVAPQRQLEPAGQAPPRDGSDRRLGRGEPGEPQRALGRPGARPQRVEGLEVGARAERHVAFPGEHHHPRVVVGDEAPVGLVQRLGGRPVDRVAPARAVDRYHGGRTRALVAHALGVLGHSLPSFQTHEAPEHVLRGS
jgi:hypothetical protein